MERKGRKYVWRRAERIVSKDSSVDHSVLSYPAKRRYISHFNSILELGLPFLSLAVMFHVQRNLFQNESSPKPPRKLD